MKITVDLVESKSTVIFVMPRRTVWKVSIVCPGKFLADQPIIRAEELEADRCWLGIVGEGVDVATDCLQEAVSSADIDVSPDEVVGGDVEQFAIAALSCNELAVF